MLQALQALGVNAAAATVYLALVTDPGVSLAILAERTDLTECALEEAVAQLASLRFIERVHPEQAPEAIVRLADPDLALAAALRRREGDLARQHQELAEARGVIATAAAAYQSSVGHSARCARPLASQQEALEMAHQLMAGAVDECVIALPDLAGALGEACAQLADLASNGARVAIICADGARSSPARTDLDRLERAGVQVRTLPIVTVRLVAGMPPPAALLWPGGQETFPSAVFARDPVFARAIAGIFESHWEMAIPLHKTLVPDPVTGLTPADQALLAMLASGLGGETAARRLGTSLTTVRRQIANLKDALNADSLFQAGCIAAKRGWV